ncbi:hypothetical protein O6486_24640, partial [Salmonella enterica subsp. enterica]
LPRVQAQGFFKLLAPRFTLPQLKGRYTQIFVDTGAFRVKVVCRRFLKLLAGFLIALTLKQETAVIIEDPGITRSTVERGTEGLFGQ